MSSEKPEVERIKVTDELQASLIKRELLSTKSPLRITAGMRRALAERTRPRRKPHTDASAAAS